MGAALSVGGLTSLLVAVIEAPGRGWSDPLVVGALATSIVLIGVFIWWESKTPHPMTQLTLFENARFSAASGALGLVFFAMVGTLFLLSQHLQFVLGFTPLGAGVRIMPVATVIVAAPMSARLNERFGTKVVVSAGLAISTIGLVLFAGTASVTDYLPVGISLAILGLGMGTAMAPATDSIMGSLPPDKAGVGSAMNFATRQVGGALGVAILGSLLAATYSAAMEPAVVGLPDDVADVASDSIGGAQRVAAELGEEGAALVASSREAFAEGLQTALWVAVGVALVGAAVTWLFLPARERVPALVQIDSPRTRS
jgi:MFS family permease